MTQKQNVPRVTKPENAQRFFVIVKDIVDTWQGRKNELDKVVTRRDLQTLGLDITQLDRISA